MSWGQTEPSRAEPSLPAPAHCAHFLAYCTHFFLFVCSPLSFIYLFGPDTGSWKRICFCFKKKKNLYYPYLRGRRETWANKKHRMGGGTRAKYPGDLCMYVCMYLTSFVYSCMIIETTFGLSLNISIRATSYAIYFQCYLLLILLSLYHCQPIIQDPVVFYIMNS